MMATKPTKTPAKKKPAAKKPAAAKAAPKAATVKKPAAKKPAARKAAPRKPKWHAWADWLLAKLAARPDIYLRELRDELKHECGVEVCLTTICNACRALEQSRKKRR